MKNSYHKKTKKLSRCVTCPLGSCNQRTRYFASNCFRATAIIDYKLPLDAHYAITASYHTIHTFQARQKLGDFTNHVIRASAHGRQNCTPVTNVLIEKLIREDKLKSKSTASGYQKASQPKDYMKLIQTWIGKLQKALQALPSSLWENLLKSKLRAVKKPRLRSWSTVWSPPQPTPKRSNPDLVFFLQLKETIFWGNILGLADLSWWSMFCLALAQYSWCQEVAPLFWQLRHSRFTESRARCASS